ncbi:MAG: hypothetical protein U5N86_05650 [Planctomycetota bacterium]|nr:hypothetical protein [Planctomycetota bacterium]
MINRGVDDFAKYLEFDSKNEEVWLKLIECYQQLGMQEKMVETLNGALEALGTSSELLRMKAELLMEQEKYDEAFAAYDKVIPGLQGEELRMLLEELYNMAVAVGAGLGFLSLTLTKRGATCRSSNLTLTKRSSRNTRLL